jgi:hypothetical protein
MAISFDKYVNGNYAYIVGNDFSLVKEILPLNCLIFRETGDSGAMGDPA